MRNVAVLAVFNTI